uniref:Bifunctional inhibitor/plant lipid transfer protein/seed storage helical domain-containing protein n=1 Tax=Opuntia streptacantha TaxID=393608 RepID=A0A7C9A1Y4_OPUST
MTPIGSLRWWLVAVLTAALASSAASQGGGSSQPPSCATKLTGCVDYLNGSRTPPPACCGPLKDAVTNERECLCSIYNNKDLLQALHINITQALNLPKLCKIDTGKSANICEGIPPFFN